MAKKGRPFLTIYTVTKNIDVINAPLQNETLGSWICRGDAIRECADKIMHDIALDANIREAVYSDENHQDLRVRLEKVSTKESVRRFFEDNDPEIWAAPCGPWEASFIAKNIARELLAYIEDELGGQCCYHIYSSQYDGATYNYDIDENDVEGTMEAWTCVTSGETDEPDEDFEAAFPEVFLSEREAIKCALDDLRKYLEDKGAKSKSIEKTLKRAEKSLDKRGMFQYEVLSGAVRRWDIWHTPITLSGELPKMSLTRRKDAKVQRNG
jgi:hypothetical protein